MNSNQTRFILLALVAGYFAFTLWSTPSRATQPGATSGQIAQQTKTKPAQQNPQNWAERPGGTSGSIALLPGRASGQTAQVMKGCAGQIKSVAVHPIGQSVRANLPVDPAGSIALEVHLDGIAQVLKIHWPKGYIEGKTPELCSSGVCEVQVGARGPYTLQLDDCTPLMIGG